jgi:hypothetical protein
MATASEEYPFLYAQARRRWADEADNEEHRQAFRDIAGPLAELALHRPEAKIAANWNPQVWASQCR